VPTFPRKTYHTGTSELGWHSSGLNEPWKSSTSSGCGHVYGILRRASVGPSSMLGRVYLMVIFPCFILKKVRYYRTPIRVMGNRFITWKSLGTNYHCLVWADVTDGNKAFWIIEAYGTTRIRNPNGVPMSRNARWRQRWCLQILLCLSGVSVHCPVAWMHEQIDALGPLEHIVPLS
jgi:hypothetical protein